MNRIRVAGIVPLKNGFAFMHRKDVIKRKIFKIITLFQVED